MMDSIARPNVDMDSDINKKLGAEQVAENNAGSAKKKKKPEHNRLRLVYRVNKRGEVSSFIHVEHSQADLIMKIISFVHKANRSVTVEDMKKGLKIKNKVLLQRMGDKLAGVLWVDINEGGSYRRLAGALVDVRKGMFHKIRNLPRFPQCYKAPYIFCPARI